MTEPTPQELAQKLLDEYRAFGAGYAGISITPELLRQLCTALTAALDANLEIAGENEMLTKWCREASNEGDRLRAELAEAQKKNALMQEQLGHLGGPCMAQAEVERLRGQIESCHAFEYRAALEQLRDYFDLGEVLFTASNRFEHAQTLVEGVIGKSEFALADAATPETELTYVCTKCGWVGTEPKRIHGRPFCPSSCGYMVGPTSNRRAGSHAGKRSKRREG